MKIAQRKVVGGIIALAALCATTIVFGRTFNMVPESADEPNIPQSTTSTGGSALTVDGQDVFVLQNGVVYRLDREMLSVKNSEKLEKRTLTKVEQIVR